MYTYTCIYIHIHAHIDTHTQNQSTNVQKKQDLRKANSGAPYHVMQTKLKTKRTAGITNVGSPNGQIWQLELQNNNINMVYNPLNKTGNSEAVSIGIID